MIIKSLRSFQDCPMPGGLPWLPGDFLYILCKIYNLSIAFMILDNTNYFSPSTKWRIFFLAWNRFSGEICHLREQRFLILGVHNCQYRHWLVRLLHRKTMLFYAPKRNTFKFYESMRCFSLHQAEKKKSTVIYLVLWSHDGYPGGHWNQHSSRSPPWSSLSLLSWPYLHSASRETI